VQRLMIGLTLRGGQIAPAITAGPDLPLAQMVVGQSPEAVAALLPRIFGLCRVAQGAAARLALGLPGVIDPAELAREVLREHLLLLLATLPPLLALSPLPVSLAAPAAALFGPARALPRGLEDFSAWLRAGSGAAPVLSALSVRFAPGVAVTGALPTSNDAYAMARVAVENTPAGRQAAHPLLQSVAATGGRGPLWRALGMLADAEAALAGALPAPRLLPDGTAVVAAARGAYALRLPQADGRVTGILRTTPTDQIAAPGGALEQSLASLPADLVALAPLVVALHDPCLPVDLHEARDA